MLLLLSCALFLAGAPVADEFGEQLARLAAPRAAERAAAERWLQGHLVLERYPALAEAALVGDAEVRARLARVLSSDPRHLGLALALCAERDASLVLLGREAVRAGVARAEPRLGEAALRDGLQSLLARAASESPPEVLRLGSNRPLGELLEELTLALDLPVGLTLDARVATSTLRRDDGPVSAPWDELLLRLASGLGVALECHGWPRGRTLEAPSGVFLRFAPRGEPARSGVELISEWLIVLALPGDEAVRVRAAKNLAATGFAPGLAWMEELVRMRGDRAAREGLLWAAARGRVASILLAPEVLAPLLAEAETAGGTRAGRILAALARAGCFDGRGGALASRLMADFDGASARGRWIRLFLLARNGCSAPELEGEARALLAAPGTPAALRLQALYTLARLGAAGAAAPEVAGLPELFGLPEDEVERELLGRALAALALAPPHADPARIPAAWGARERRALLHAWLWQAWLLERRPEPAAAHLAVWLQGDPAGRGARGEALAEELRAWLVRGAGTMLEEALEGAKGLAPALVPELERVRLLLGLVPAAEVPAVLARTGLVLAGPQADLAVLAALGGYPVALEVDSAARETLLALLGSAQREQRSEEDARALVAALERTAQGLYSGGRDELAETFASSVRQVLQRPKSTLGRIDGQSWPPPPFAAVRDVSRAMARCALPASL